MRNSESKPPATLPRILEALEPSWESFLQQGFISFESSALHRRLVDQDNRLLEVWRVLPAAAQRADAFSAPLSVAPGYENGWLCFESNDGEKRRLAPVPESWETTNASQLDEWCKAAIRVSANRGLR